MTQPCGEADGTVNDQVIGMFLGNAGGEVEATKRAMVANVRNFALAIAGRENVPGAEPTMVEWYVAFDGLIRGELTDFERFLAVVLCVEVLSAAARGEGGAPA